MSAVVIIRKLVSENAAVLAIVPAARIMTGVLPLSIVMPAISIGMVSGTPWNTISMLEPNRLYTDRIQVSILVKNPQSTPPGNGYPEMDRAIPLIRTACANRSGAISGISGISVDSILPDQEGPDLSDMTVGFTQRSIDFIVKYRRTA